MTYKKQEYGFVTEWIEDGKTYQRYRSVINPKVEIVLCDGKVINGTN